MRCTAGPVHPVRTMCVSSQVERIFETLEMNLLANEASATPPPTVPEAIELLGYSLQLMLSHIGLSAQHSISAPCDESDALDYEDPRPHQRLLALWMEQRRALLSRAGEHREAFDEARAAAETIDTASELQAWRPTPHSPMADTTLTYG